MAQKLEQLIRQYIRIPFKPNPNGWYPCVHTRCDHGKKGNRAGFRFDGDVVVFRCFNCVTTTSYDPRRDKTIPIKMASVLDDFNIPKTEYEQIIFDNYGKTFTDPETKQVKLELEPKEIPLPPNTFLLTDKPDNKWVKVANAYLEYERDIDPKSYPFMLSEDKQWEHRLIIPIYKGNKLIYFEGRDLTGKNNPKYKSAVTTKSKIFYGYDEIEKRTSDPLYILEGFFKARSINGVAVFGNQFYKPQIQILNMCPRPKIVIPDRTRDGFNLAKQAIKLGWSVAIPDIGDCKDVDEGIQKYGRLYVLQSIIEHTYTDNLSVQIVLGGCYDENKKNPSSKKS